MNKKNKFKERIFMVLFMTGISAFFVSAISVVHLSTKETVRRNENLFLKRSVLYTAGIPFEKDPLEIEKVFNKKVTVSQNDGLPKYTVHSEKGTIKIYTVQGKGLWGEIIAHVGLFKDMKMSGISFIKQSETPGLGARIDEKWFKEQFRGKKGPFSTVPEGSTSQINEFDAVTGATITTKAVEDILNTTYKKLSKEYRE